MDWTNPEVALTTAAASAGTTLLVRYGVRKAIDAFADLVATRKVRAEHDRIEAQTELLDASTLADVISEVRKLRSEVDRLTRDLDSAVTAKLDAIERSRLDSAAKAMAERERDEAKVLAAFWEGKGRLAIAQRDQLLRDTTSGRTTPGFVPEWADKEDTIPPPPG